MKDIEINFMSHPITVRLPKAIQECAFIFINHRRACLIHIFYGRKLKPTSTYWRREFSSWRLTGFPIY